MGFNSGFKGLNLYVIIRQQSLILQRTNQEKFIISHVAKYDTLHK